VSHFVEHVARDKVLTYLDLSLNQINFRGAFVLEDALVDHPRLRHLDVSHNPLGTFGMRSIARLFTMCMSLTHLQSTECFKVTGDERLGEQLFHMTDPAGSYNLGLSFPYGRAVLRLLYKTCERLQVKMQNAFDIQTSRLDDKPLALPNKKDSEGIWPVPTSGELQVCFNPGLADAVRLEDEEYVEPILDHYCKRVRLKPHLLKIVQLLSWYDKLCHREQEQLLLLDMLAKDFSLTYSHMRQFCKSRDIASAAICRLLPCVEGGHSVRYLCTLFAPSASDYRANQRRLIKFMSFTAENPSGYYRLQLDNAPEYAVAERLLLLSRWEASASARQGVADSSKRGDRSHLRNMRHEQRSLRVSHTGEPWQLPECGVFEFDYVSARRPSASALPLSQDAFQELLTALRRTGCSSAEKLAALRGCSQYLYLTCSQLRSLLGCFDNKDARLDAFVMLLFRLVDIHNEKMCRARFSNADLASLLHRLGHVTYFPFVQVEQMRFELDFSVHDQRLAAHLLMNLHDKEHGEFRNTSYVRADGSVDTFPHGVPRSWLHLEKIPPGGVAHFQYMASSRALDYGHRQLLLETYGGWKQKLPADQVRWWRKLGDVPKDVLIFTLLIKKKFPGVDVAFQALVGDASLRGLNWKTFLEGMLELKWKWFTGPEGKKRLNRVFDYLSAWKKDREVLAQEWAVLDQILEEMELQLQEFQEFVVRIFDGNFETFWAAVDKAGNGKVPVEDWQRQLEQYGYFGDAEDLIALVLDSSSKSVTKEVAHGLLEAGSSHRRGAICITREPAASNGFRCPFDALLGLIPDWTVRSVTKSRASSHSKTPSEAG